MNSQNNRKREREQEIQNIEELALQCENQEVEKVENEIEVEEIREYEEIQVYEEIQEIIQEIQVQEAQQLRIVAWNPNGIRALFNKNESEVKRLISEKNPNVIIFNETKGNQKMLKDMEKCVNTCFSSFNWYWNNSLKPGRHGCAVGIDKNINVLSVNYGFVDKEKEHEGRLVTLELNNYIIVGLYAVNAGIERLNYKIEWMGKLTQYLEQLRMDNPEKIIIAAGDWNVAPEDIDLYNPKGNRNTSGFTKEERDCFRNFLANGWTDVFRQRNPKKVAYSFWNMKFAARKTNKGWRIDHFVINDSAIGRVKSCEILNHLGSDHAPIYLMIE